MNDSSNNKFIEELRKVIAKNKENQIKLEVNRASLEMNMAKFGISNSDLGKTIEIGAKTYKEKLEKIREELEKMRKNAKFEQDLAIDTFERKLSEHKSKIREISKMQEIEQRAHWDKFELLKNSMKKKAIDWEKAFEELKSSKVLNEKKVAQVKVYLTESEKRILENLAKEQKSDNSSVMRELLRTKGNPNHIIKPFLYFGTRESSFSDPSEVTLKVFEPKNFDDIQEYIDYLEKGCPIIINLEKINDSDSNITQRCIDFISGATYKTKSKIVFVGEKSILVTTSKCSLKINQASIEEKQKDD